MKTIDLRSDTVTRPTAAMREAIAKADVGDDVYGEDPCVNQLEERAAGLLGKEAAVLVPSGTMANQVALRVLTRPGDVILAGESAHIKLFEGGGAWALSGVQVEAIGSEGFFSPEDILAALPPDDHHYAQVTAIALENTHNASGGRVWPVDLLDAVCAVARERDLRVHLDGARIFNASLASGVSTRRLAAGTDTVSFCLSKGLGAPVGSLVCCDAERVAAIRRARKLMGGGMRQAGVLAAAGLHALEHHVERLVDDHANASRLADGLARLGLEVESSPQTNIVMFRVDEPGPFAREIRDRGVLIGGFGPGRFRAVTHLDVTAADVDDALARIAEALRP